MELRNYQKEAVEAIHNNFKNNNESLLVLPTGSGKTNVFSQIAKDYIEQGKKVLILAHREELILQAKNRLKDDFNVSAGIEKAGYDRPNCENIIIASVFSLLHRLKDYDKNYFDLIIIDEAHHSLANSYRTIYDYFFNAKLLGVTATPFRGDNKSLEKVYKNGITYSYDIITGIHEGYLSHVKTKLLDIELDVSKLRIINNSHYAEDELDDVLEQAFIDKLGKLLAEEINDKKTVIFTPSLNSSKTIIRELKKYNVKAVEINGEMDHDKRSKIIKDFSNDKIKTLVNCQILTEGFDCPDIDCIVVLRPTNSKTLYYQMTGRGLRISPNKDALTLIDVKWVTGNKFNIMEPIDLLLKNDEFSYIDFDDLSEEELLAYCPDEITIKREDNQWNIFLNDEDITSNIRKQYEAIFVDNDSPSSSGSPSSSSSMNDKLKKEIKKIIQSQLGEIDILEAIQLAKDNINGSLESKFKALLNNEVNSVKAEQEFWVDNNKKILVLKNLPKKTELQALELSKRLIHKYEPVKEYFSDYMWNLFVEQSKMVYPYTSIAEYLMNIKQYALLEYSPFDYKLIDDTKEATKWFNKFKDKKVNPWGGVTAELYFKIVSFMKSRIDSKMASVKQLNLLAKYGIEGDRTFDNASMLIDLIAKNKWQINDIIIEKANDQNI